MRWSATLHEALAAAGDSARSGMIGPFANENKGSTKPDFSQQSFTPPAGLTEAGPTGLRHDAGPPQSSTAAVADHRSQSGKQGD